MDKIPFFCIHLARETHREAHMTILQNRMGCHITTWIASDGSTMDLRKWPRRHPIERETRPGAIGCLDSHIRLLENMIAEGHEMIGIFEDDAEVVVDRKVIDEFVNGAPEWDILILGANEWVDPQTVRPGLVRVTRFWGTHGFLIKHAAAKSVLAAFKHLYRMGFAYPADWLYAQSIIWSRLRAYGPADCKAFMRQVPGLPSAITGHLRA